MKHGLADDVGADLGKGNEHDRGVQERPHPIGAPEIA